MTSKEEAKERRARYLRQKMLGLEKISKNFLGEFDEGDDIVNLSGITVKISSNSCEIMKEEGEQE